MKKRNWFLNLILIFTPIATLAHLFYLIFVSFNILSLIYVFVYPIHFFGIIKRYRWAFFYGLVLYTFILIEGLLNREYVSLIALVGMWFYYKQKDYFTE
ncbi:hypothetical protein KAT24_01570 [Candidatus Pacearchaeota archaeon]|nr:hypothetical protein [Candidatus Pacearchaeota archaeon]